MQGPIFGHAGESGRPSADFFRIGTGIHPRQAAATIERPDVARGDGAADGDARQAEAVVGRIVAECGDGVGDGEARQATAFVERIFAD